MWHLLHACARSGDTWEIRSRARTRSDEGLAKAFASVDSDGSGKISQAEMVAYVQKVYGKGIDEQMINEMMRKADKDTDGEVDFKEVRLSSALRKSRTDSMHTYVAPPRRRQQPYWMNSRACVCHALDAVLRHYACRAVCG